MVITRRRGLLAGGSFVAFALKYGSRGSAEAQAKSATWKIIIGNREPILNGSKGCKAVDDYIAALKKQLDQIKRLEKTDQRFMKNVKNEMVRLMAELDRGIDQGNKALADQGLDVLKGALGIMAGGVLSLLIIYAGGLVFAVGFPLLVAASVAVVAKETYEHVDAQMQAITRDKSVGKAVVNPFLYALQLGDALSDVFTGKIWAVIGGVPREKQVPEEDTYFRRLGQLAKVVASLINYINVYQTLKEFNDWGNAAKAHAAFIDAVKEMKAELNTLVEQPTRIQGAEIVAIAQTIQALELFREDSNATALDCVVPIIDPPG